MERSPPTSGRSATPADINRNGRPTSIGTGGRHQSECPADIIGMRILEVDAEDLFRDHAADRRRVQRRYVADPGQHDRKILLFDGSCNDGNRRRSVRRGASALLEMLPGQVTHRDQRYHHQTDDQRRAPPMLRGLAEGFPGNTPRRFRPKGPAQQWRALARATDGSRTGR